MEYCPQNAGVCITNRLFLLSSYAKSNSRPPAPYFAEPIEVFDALFQKEGLQNDTVRWGG